jgi:diguanylate cyclase (GGDEF)-like protein
MFRASAKSIRFSLSRVFWRKGLQCLLFLAGAAGWSHAAAVPVAPIVLQDEQRSVAVWPAVTILPDPGHQLSIEDVLARADRFVAPPPTSGTLGVRREAMWLHIPLAVDAASDGRWILELDHHDLNRIDVYLVSDGRVIDHALLGSLHPRAEKDLLSRSHAHALDLMPGQRYELLMRVQTQGAMILPIQFHKFSALLRHAVNEQMLQGVLAGLALCLILYSLAQWVSLREPLFIQYALMTTGSLLFTLHFFGLGGQYLWPGSTWFEVHAGGLSALMATAGSFLFIGQILSGHAPHSPFLRVMRAGAALSGLIALAYMLDILNTQMITAIVSILGLTPAFMGIQRAVRLARLGDQLGRTLLLAWLIYFGSTAVVIGVIQGWVQMNFWSLHAFQFGSTVDMLLFLHVLGLRTKASRLAAMVANQERDAMRSLAHTDPLTGLLNRRGLGDALGRSLVNVSDEQLLAVYMLDLDGFKPVNDQYGHDVGDDLLVAVTSRLQGHVRQGDVVARLGGDEFVVVAGGLGSPVQAHELGLKLLGAFGSPFSLGDIKVKVGLTIGYALAPTDSNDAFELLKLADIAMYSGKQDGKCCMRRFSGTKLHQVAA